MDEKILNKNNKDIVEIALPEYFEEQNAIPDVETESSFAENREEIFLRNRELAAKAAETPVYREAFPDDPNAEEIYPQLKAVPDREPVAAVNTAAKNTGAFAGIREKLGKLTQLEKICVSAVVAVIAIAVIVVISKGSDSSINAAAIETADKKAKEVHTAASVCLAELFVEGKEINGDNFANSGTVFSFGDNDVNTAETLGNNFTGYVYGRYNAENGAVEYALWSKEPIPEEYMRLLTDSEQEALSRKGIIIGCYPVAE